MVKIDGKYEIADSKNFKELLVRGGVPEDKAQIANDIKTVLTITVDGKKIKLQSDENLGNHVSDLVLDEEVDEKLLTGSLKSTAKLNGNVLTVESKGSDGKYAGKRTYTFSDSGLEIIYASAKDNFTATRVYKRI